jgi:hypothetical protein
MDALFEPSETVVVVGSTLTDTGGSGVRSEFPDDRMEIPAIPATTAPISTTILSALNLT